MKESRFWRQAKWRDEDLRTLNFRPYLTRRQLRMARVIEALSTIDTRKKNSSPRPGRCCATRPVQKHAHSNMKFQGKSGQSAGFWVE